MVDWSRIGETISTGGLSEALSSGTPDQRKMEALAATRSEFIEEVYPAIFGPEEMGDPAAQIVPEEMTAVLALYEAHLVKNGLLKITRTR